MSYLPEDKVSYHNNMTSFDDGVDFFEEVLGGIQHKIDELSEDSEEDDTSSDSESSSSEESGCGCNGNRSESEIEDNPFMEDDNKNNLDEVEDNSFMEDDGENNLGEVEDNSFMKDIDGGDDLDEEEIEEEE